MRQTGQGWLVVLIGWAMSMDALMAQSDTDPVVVVVRSQNVLRNRAVKIEDVAELRGGNEKLRQQIGQLDLEQLDDDQSSVTIRKRFVEFRIKLADIPKNLFQVKGAEDCVLAVLKQPLSEDHVIAVARDALVRKLPWKPEELSVRLIQPIGIQLPAVIDVTEVTMKAEPHNPHPSLGRCQMNVQLFVRGEKKLAFPVFLEAKLMQTVILARKAIAKGETLTESHLLVDTRPVDPNQKSNLSIPDLLGKRPKRNISAGQTIQFADIDDQGAAEKTIVIKAKQPVKMVVQVGGLKIGATGEALQNGRVGELIRLQNIDSKKVVIGRVIDSTTVEVDGGGLP